MRFKPRLIKPGFFYLALLLTPFSISAEPSLYRAIYKADYQGLPISAKGVRELIREEDGTYTLISTAKAFFASIIETTKFRFDADQIIPIQYQYHRKGIGKNRDAVLNFDWEQMKVLNDVESKPWEMTIPTGATDKLLYQFKLREDLLRAYEAGEAWPTLEYTIADGGRLKHYVFKVVGEETIDTPVGKLRTIKATRVKNNSKRTSTFWMAPSYDFLLVRFQQVEENGKGFELLLREAEFNGKPI